MQYRAFVNAACTARSRAHPPSSGFKVSAALAMASGEVLTGCNIENLLFGLIICAERAAVAAAISNGNRDFATIAVATDSTERPVPCGACRQVLSGFNPNLKIIATTGSGQVQEFDLAKLFPAPDHGILETMRRV